jgi:hypothetical protein
VERTKDVRLDFMPVFFAAVLAFVLAGLLDLSRSLPDGERGLLLFEKACPIYHKSST